MSLVPAATDVSSPSEALLSLRDLAEGRTGRIPADFLARHVLSVTSGAGWPVQRAALDAVLRRMAAAKQDGLAVASAPTAVLGLYATRRKGEGERPYKVLLERVDPLCASCDCRDFVRNSLGLCKHVLAILPDVFAARPKGAASPAPARDQALLTWDPVRPLTGPGDWLERVRFVEPGGALLRRDGGDRLRRQFRREADGVGALRAAPPGDPVRRLERVEALWEAATRRRELSADPALVALLRHERERWRRVLEARPDPAQVRRALRTLKRPLYAYQEEGVRRFLASGRLLIADDMGLGKTAQAIAACHILLHLKSVERGLLIVPASLKDQWLREWRLFSDTPLSIVDGNPENRAAAYRSTRRGFLVTNYEQVLRDLEIIRRFRPEIVVLDEAQRIKNWATKTAAYVKALTPTYRLVLTGTPMENRLEELASILDWVDDMALEPKWRLLPAHSQYADGKREIVGARRLDTLRERLSGCLLRRGRSEVIKQLPSRTDTIVPVAITEAQAEAHAELDMPIARIVGRARRRPLTPQEFLKLKSLLTTQRIIANGIAQLRFEEMWPAVSRLNRRDEATLAELASPKLGHLREILAQVVVQQGRKVVVFSQWRRMLTLAHWAVSDLLEEASLRAVFFTGQERAARRTHNIVDFHDDPRARVMFATDAGGVGLNLQRAASCCVNLDLPWNPAVLEQRISRIYRLGQKRPIDAYNLVTEASIEARIAGIIADKKALFSGLFDGDSNEVRFERSPSFLARLERIIEPARAPLAAEGTPEEEGAAEREIERVVAAADESEEAAAVGQAAPQAERVLAEGPPRTPPAEAPSPAASEVRGLMAQITIRRREDGGLAIDAPPAAAEGLAALFEGMARLLRLG